MKVESSPSLGKSAEYSHGLSFTQQIFRVAEGLNEKS